MPLTTLPGDQKQDDSLNPANENYKKVFNDIAQAEEKGTVDERINDLEDAFNGPSATEADRNAHLRTIDEREKQGDKVAADDNSIKSTFTGEKNKSKKTKKVWFKRAAPILGVGGTFTIFGIVMIALTTPSLLIVQMKEVMTGKFNTQLSSMELRSNKLLLAKVAGATKGVCSKRIAVACKFSSLNDHQVKSLKKAGFTFEGESKGTFGRTTITGMVFDGKKIDAANFPSTIASDSKIRNAFKTSYNPKYGGFVGKAWAAVAAKYKINKQKPDLGGEDPEKAKQKLLDISKEGMVDDAGGGKTIAKGDYKDPDCQKDGCVTWTQEDADEANKAAASVADDGKSGGAKDKVKSAFFADLSSNTAIAQLGSLVKVTGIADSVCTAIGAFNTLTYAAKAVRVLQLVRYMMVFSTVADAIKAGDNPKPEDVAFLGTLLTSTVVSAADKTKTLVQSGTDSFGYKYAAYGDSTASKASMNIANRSMAGGGMVGDLSNFSNTIYGFFGDRATARDNARTTCGVLANPAVQVGSIIIGVAAMFVPGVNVGLELTKAGAGALVSVGIALIPSLVADIVAGSVTDGIVGEESVNAIASGSGSLLSDSLAGQNGAAAMTKEDALAYNNLQTEVNNQYIADELKDTSPLDANNPHTFLGSIVATLLPLSSKSNPLATVGSLLSSSLKSIVPTTKALSTEDYKKSLEVCQDPDAQDGEYAVDPFCNIIRGIPPKYLDRDPVEVAQDLYDKGLITDDGTPQGDYPDFIKKCMTSDEPFGYSSGSEFNISEVKNCVINDDNANYYLYYMDQRIELGQSGEDIADATAQTSTSTDKKALAQKIIAKNKVTYLASENVKPTLESIADGSVDADAEPCGININILRMLDVITDKHSVALSDINRHCTGSLASSTGSRHYAGNGSAVDIAVIDGVATTGRDANATSVINLVMPILSQAAVSTGSFSQIGQVNCGNTPPLSPSVTTITDSCNHLHLDVPAKSDLTLKYNPSGW